MKAEEARKITQQHTVAAKVAATSDVIWARIEMAARSGSWSLTFGLSEPFESNVDARRQLIEKVQEYGYKVTVFERPTPEPPKKTRMILEISWDEID